MNTILQKRIEEAPENYPVQFRDKIDEYLWKEHQILGGCCSSIENMKYAVAREVAEKLTDVFTEKACEWLKKNADSYTWYNEMEGESGMIDEFIDDFKNYIKGE